MYGRGVNAHRKKKKMKRRADRVPKPEGE